MGIKRIRDRENAVKKHKKRQKVETTLADIPKAEVSQFVDIDSLDWKTSQLPDRLENAEGFFGLEEIEGVEVVQPESNKQVKFKVANNIPLKSILKSKDEETQILQYDEDETEWAGFSDDEGQHGTGDVEKKNTKKDKIDEKTNKKKKNREMNAHKDDTESAQLSLPFTVLQDELDEDGVDSSAWDSLGLSTAIQTGLSRLKYSSPTPIQKSCIPYILAGHDIIGKAPTGSGKTLAFGIPILEHFLNERNQGFLSGEQGETAPVALILSPTRELAHQLAKHVADLNAHTPDADAKIALLTGGLSIQKQQRLLKDANVVIGTPGRVWEILSSGSGLITKMRRIKYLVVDEADRLLSEGHFQEMEKILQSLDREENPGATDFGSEVTQGEAGKRRQTLVFSATFHRGLQQKLAGKGMAMNSDTLDNKQSMEYLLKKLKFREDRPKFVDVNPVSQMAEGLKEGVVECGAMEKDLYLYTLLLYHSNYRCLIFTNSISAVRHLAHFLQNLGIPAMPLHSNMEQKARLRSVERFSAPSNSNSVLVATDVAARGLDIKGINMIVHYHVPRTADAYVHRSGRTARAGAVGKSVLICSPEEAEGVARLVAKVHAQAKPTNPVKRTPLESLELDRRVVARVRPRVSLAKRITESTLAKEKLSAEDNWLRNAAEELGVDYDGEEFDQQSGRAKGRGRGGGRHQKEKQVGSISKAELGALRAELKQLLAKRINIGVSERYVTAGRIDVDALIQGQGNKTFIGPVDTLNF